MCVYVCVFVSRVWCEGALHTRLDVGSGADYTRGCEAHVITSYSLVCYHLLPSARLESFLSALSGCLLKTLCDK